MSTGVRALAGFAAIVPIVVIFATAGYAVYAMLSHDLASHGTGAWNPVETFIDLGLWKVVLAASVCAALFQVVAMIGFSVHALMNKSLPDAAKVLWIVAFYLVGSFALPVYWLLHMVRGKA